MKPQSIQNIINETCEYTNNYVVKTISGTEYRLANDEFNMLETHGDLLVYHGDDGTTWIECDKIESIEI